MVRYGLKDVKDYERKAKISGRLGDDMHGRQKGYEKMSGYHEKAARYYEKAGDILTQLNMLRMAQTDYQEALRNAWTKESKSRIKGKIESLSHNGKRLEKLLAIFSIGCLGIASVFVSFNLTGAAVGTRDSHALISTILFIFGVALAFFYFKERNRRI